MARNSLFLFVLLAAFFAGVALVRAADLSAFQAESLDFASDATFIANGAGMGSLRVPGGSQQPRIAFYQMDTENQEYLRLPQLEIEIDSAPVFDYVTENNATTWQTVLKSNQDGSLILAAVWTQNTSSSASPYPSFASLVVFYWNITAQKYAVFDRLLFEQIDPTGEPVRLDAFAAPGNLSSLLVMTTRGTTTRVYHYARMGGAYLFTWSNWYYNTNASEPKSLTLSPDGGAYATAPGWSNGFVVLRDMNTGNVLTTANVSTWGVKPYTMALLRGGRYLIVGDPSQSVVWGAAYDPTLGTYDPSTLQPFLLPPQPSSQYTLDLGQQLIAVEGDSPVSWAQNSGISQCGMECNVLGLAELYFNKSSARSQTPTSFVWQYNVELMQWVPWNNPLLPFGPATASQNPTQVTVDKGALASVRSTNFVVLGVGPTGLGVFWRGNMANVVTDNLAWSRVLSPPSAPSGPAPDAKKRESSILFALKIAVIVAMAIVAASSILVLIYYCSRHQKMDQKTWTRNLTQ